MARRTVLYESQRTLGGKLIDFQGWEMPVQFAGIATEHHCVRTACGAFDLGHMGRLQVDGAGALAFLGSRVCRRLADIKSGQVRYGLVLAQDGTVEDDVLVSCQGATSFHVVVNAGNRERILELWRDDAVRAGVALSDLSEAQAMIAVQGPQAAGLLSALGVASDGMRYYSFAERSWQGVPLRLSRTGYTGEDGFECFLPTAQAVAFWQALIAAGARPCGLGARDSLRLEAGMPLYGHELDRSVTPVEAGLGFAVNPTGGFTGAAVVLAQLKDGPPRRLVGVLVPERRVPRQGYAVLSAGAPVGRITSGTLSPTLGTAIGMAYVPAALAAPGTAIGIDVRGTVVAAEVVPLPFYKREKKT